MILRWEKEQPLSPVYWKISCPLSQCNSLENGVPQSTYRGYWFLPATLAWSLERRPSSTHQTRQTIPLIPQLLSSVSSLCYHLHVLGCEAKGDDSMQSTQIHVPHKHVLMEKVQPRQIGIMQWPSLQSQFCCLSQLQFSQEPEGKEDRGEHCALNPVQDSTWEKPTLYFHWFRRRDIISRML